MEEQEVTVEPFVWGRRYKKRAEQLEEYLLEQGIVRFRPSHLAEIANSLGFDLNTQAAIWFVRKYWKWERVVVHHGSVYVHPDHYQGYEAEVTIAQEEGLFEPPSYENGTESLLSTC